MHLPNAAVAVEPQPQPSWRVIAGTRSVPRQGVPRAWVIASFALFAAVMVLYVHSVQFEVSLSETQREIQALKDKNTSLRAQLASVENPSAIESLATQRLRMKTPDEVVYMKKPAAPKSAGFDRIPPPPAVVHEGF